MGEALLAANRGKGDEQWDVCLRRHVAAFAGSACAAGGCGRMQLPKRLWHVVYGQCSFAERLRDGDKLRDAVRLKGKLPTALLLLGFDEVPGDEDGAAWVRDHQKSKAMDPAFQVICAAFFEAFTRHGSEHSEHCPVKAPLGTGKTGSVCLWPALFGEVKTLVDMRTGTGRELLSHGQKFSAAADNFSAPDSVLHLM